MKYERIVWEAEERCQSADSVVRDRLNIPASFAVESSQPKVSNTNSGFSAKIAGRFLLSE
jgi:hypothetical protein